MGDTIMKRAVVTLLSCALSAAFVASAAWSGAALPPAPAWQLNDMNGGERRLEEWRGKWILMKFGTTHCPNCSIELEEMAKIKDQIQALGVEVLDIYLRERKYNVKKYLEKLNVDFKPTVLYDWRGTLITDYGVSIIPHLVLVDPKGDIAWQGEYTPADELLKLMEAKVRGSGAASK
jgi:peroxiredoxin